MQFYRYHLKIIILGLFVFTSLRADNGMLNFLYKNPVGQILRPLFTGQLISRIAGWYTKRRFSSVHIRRFINTHNIDMSEHADRSTYKTFNDFFTRTLIKPRTIDSDPRSIISPADGQLMVIENIQPHSEFLVKGKPLNLEKLLGSKTVAKDFYGGTLMVIYLAPWNYHRFHFPCAAIPSFFYRLSGSYESVNTLVYKSGIQPLYNERRLIMLDHPVIGQIAFIAIGALCVGQITQTYIPGTLYQKGAEMGYFSFGGSSVVLLFKPNTIAHVLSSENKTPFSISVKMGQPIAHLKTIA